MRFGWLAVLLLLPFVCLITAESQPQINAVRLPLYQKQYVRLHVGNPGRVLTLRLRWDQDTSRLYDDPKTYSSTFSDQGSDIFYFGDVKIRVPVVYGRETDVYVSGDTGDVIEDGTRSDTDGGVLHQGSLGLGPRSIVWRYWMERTVSRHTLTLGKYDIVDVRGNSNSLIESNINQQPTLAGFFSCCNNTTAAHALELKLETEFTYLPASMYRHIKLLLDRRDFSRQNARAMAQFHSGGSLSSGYAIQEKARIEISSNDNNDTTSHLWIGSGLLYIVTSYGSHERVIRMADTDPLNQVSPNTITLGRLHMLEQHVYYENLVTGRVRLDYVFDAYPAIERGLISHGWMSVIGLVLCSWWFIEMRPMIYQWMLSGIAPKAKRIIKRLERFSAVKWFVTTNTNAPETKPQSNDLALPRHPSPLSVGPLDWIAIPYLLFIARLYCFTAAFVSLFGFRSARFAQQLALLGHLPTVVGSVAYYGLVVWAVAGPMVVNSYFLRRYTRAGSSLVTTALLAATLLSQMPYTENLFYRHFFNLVYGTLMTCVAFEWPFYVLLAGLDSRLTNNIIRAGEYSTDAEFISQRSATHADSAKIFDYMYRSASEVVRRAAANSRSVSLLGDPLAPQVSTRLASDIRRGDTEQAVSSVLHDSEHQPMEYALLCAWTLILLPFSVLFMLSMVLLPLAEYLFVRHPWRIWLCISYLASVIVYQAFMAVSGTVLQQAREYAVSLRKSMIRIYDKAVNMDIVQ